MRGISIQVGRKNRAGQAVNRRRKSLDGPLAGATSQDRMGRSLAIAREPKIDRRIRLLLYPETGHWRPKTRGDCEKVPRPCPYVGCRHHLALDADGEAIRMDRPDEEIWDRVAPSCSLDLAEEGGLTHDQIAAAMSVTRQRAHQLEIQARANYRIAARRMGIALPDGE